MKKVYLAGPIWDVIDPMTWRLDVAEQLPEDWEAVNPLHISKQYVEGDDPRQIIDVDLTAIEESDAVLALINQPSWGTAMEIFYAHELGLPVIGWQPKYEGRFKSPPNSPWLTVTCSLITSDLDKVMEFLRGKD